MSAEETTAGGNVYISLQQPESSMIEPEVIEGWARIPIAVKDNIDVAGFATTGGAHYLEHISSADAPSVARLRSRGAHVLGKTNLHELALGVTSNNATFGPVRNPLNKSLAAGGSSGGSAATIAYGTVPLSLGTDTGGSISIPAAFCGVAGFRPSTGRYPSDGVLHLSPTRDTIGTHANSIGDLRIADEVLSSRKGQPVEAPTEIICGVPTSFITDVDDAVGQSWEQAAEVLQQGRCRLVRVDLHQLADELSFAGRTIVGWEAPRSLVEHLRAKGFHPEMRSLEDLAARTASPDVAATVRGWIESPVREEDYAQALRTRAQLQEKYVDIFRTNGLDVLVFPTVPVLPPPIGQDRTVDLSGQQKPLFPTITRHVTAGTVLGTPMATVPTGRQGVTSTAVTIQGMPNGDLRLLRIAETIESTLR
ncbi:amidase family protein [Microbacterium sp. USTB-Y]|uniref:amidase family protein n=1 Tax=Microbacterium sp. USTB-Y TaxID=2823692 RepID=UPI00204151BE|nr:amidase family protein [Microbacterium sp. USTB-Y]